MNKNSFQFNLNKINEIITKIVNECNNPIELYFCMDTIQDLFINNFLQRNNKFNEQEQQCFINLCKFFKGVMENENNNNW